MNNPNVPNNAAPRIHVVQRGEYLSGIAIRYGITMQALAAANGISQPDRIYPGQKLVIPNPVVQPPPPAPPGYRYYTVQPGEILSMVAVRANLSVEQLAALNRINPPYDVQPGQQILVPTATPDPTTRTHTVQPGEYLLGIALKYNVSMEELARLNNIRPPYLLSNGQVLNLPGNISIPPGGATPPGNATYTAQPGDYLLGIALKYNVSLEALAQANNLRPPYSVSPGQVLRIPANAGPAPAPIGGGTQPLPSQPPPSQPPAPQPTQPTNQVGRTHTVKDGEFLLSIALKYSLSMEAVAKANNLAPPYYLTVGQVLRIPQA
jgi:lysozyme